MHFTENQAKSTSAGEVLGKKSLLEIFWRNMSKASKMNSFGLIGTFISSLWMTKGSERIKMFYIFFFQIRSLISFSETARNSWFGNNLWILLHFFNANEILIKKTFWCQIFPMMCRGFLLGYTPEYRVFLLWCKHARKAFLTRSCYGFLSYRHVEHK